MLKDCKKSLVEENPPQSLPWKQNSLTVVAAVMIVKVVINWRSITDKYFEKTVRLWPKSPSVTGKVCYHYNSWVAGVYKAYICLTEIPEEKHLILSDYLN